MKRALLFLAILSLASLARADDQTRTVQQALKDQGFYYGDVDGQPGPETDAAIRRYQIREGLEVTGSLDAETAASLNQGGQSGQGDNSDNTNNTVEAAPSAADNSAASQPAPAAQDSQMPAPSVVQGDHDFLQQQPPAQPPPSGDDQQAPPPSQPPPQQALPPEVDMSAAYSRYLRKTPYETAPLAVQQSTIQRAQARLAREGFYHGIVDGALRGSMDKALSGYQRYADLRVTGRLDIETLEDMNLLPRPRRPVVIAPPPPYGYGPPPVVVGRPVYPGIWVH
jgi:peptidoglycan hydrolase-like protein with peptidoglycan-binding domain